MPQRSMISPAIWTRCQINGIIRRVAAENQQKGVRLADLEAVANQSSPHSLAGSELLLEQVHLNFEGNYLVAHSIAEQIEKSLPQAGQNPWPTADDCARRLGFNDFARRAADIDILARLNAPPFTDQPDNRFSPRCLRIRCEPRLRRPRPPQNVIPPTGFFGTTLQGFRCKADNLLTPSNHRGGLRA